MEKPLLSNEELADLKHKNPDAKDMIMAGIKLFFKKYNADMFNNYTEYAYYFLEYIKVNNIPLMEYAYDIYESLFQINELNDICGYLKVLNDNDKLITKLIYIYDLYNKNNYNEIEYVPEEINDKPIEYDYNKDDEDINNKDYSTDYEYNEEDNQNKNDDEIDNEKELYSSNSTTSFHIALKEYDNKNEEYVGNVQKYKKICDRLTAKNEINYFLHNKDVLKELKSHLLAYYVDPNSKKTQIIYEMVNAFENNNDNFIRSNYAEFKSKLILLNPKLWYNLVTSKKINYLNESESKELAEAKKEWNYYETYLIEHNYKLIKSKIIQYNTLLENDDIESAAIEGFRKAIYLFNPSFNLKFSTYAVKCMERNIIRVYHNTSTIVHIPVHAHILKYKVKGFINQYEIDHGHEPTYEEIAKEFNSNIDYVKYIMNFKSDMTSLDMTIGDDQDTALIDFISTENNPVEDNVIQKVGEYEQLYKALDSFEDERTRNVLKERFGLNEEHREKTLEEVGQMYGITRERVRQIEAKALRKLKQKYCTLEHKNMIEAQSKSKEKNKKDHIEVPKVTPKLNVELMLTLTKPKTREELRNEKK